MILAASWSSEQSAASPTGAEVVAVATGGETVAADPIPLPLIVVGKGVGFEVAVGVRGISVGAGCVGTGVGDGTAVGAIVGTAVNTALTLASTVASIAGVAVGATSVVSDAPPQATSNITAVEKRSSRMDLSFTKPYYPKRLRNGSAEATAYWQYVSDEPSGRRSLRHWSCGAS